MHYFCYIIVWPSQSLFTSSIHLICGKIKDVLKKAPQEICNVKLVAFSWSQATLPLGGLYRHFPSNKSVSPYISGLNSWYGSVGKNRFASIGNRTRFTIEKKDFLQPKEETINGHEMMLLLRRLIRSSWNKQQTTPL